MSRFDIRRRMLLAALLPVVLVSALLAVFFVMSRVDDLEQSYHERTRSVVRQLALASEFGLWSVDQPQLSTVLRGVLKEPDVIGGAIIDRDGQVLVSVGDDSGAQGFAFTTEIAATFDAKHRVDILGQTVFAPRYGLDAIYDDSVSHKTDLRAPLGKVVVIFSRKSMDERRQHMLTLGGLSTLAGLAFGVLLAFGLSRGVIRPIVRVTRLIERIGRGDFSVPDAAINGTAAMRDPLGQLHTTLYQMAQRLSHARDDLELKVSMATKTMREKMEEAEHATEAKTRFLAAASHDLRQPTHALGLFVTRLAQLPHDDQTRGLVVNLQASVLAMQNLLDSLLDISRLEAKAIPVVCQSFGLNGLLAQLQQDLEQDARNKGLQLRIRQTEIYVSSDPTLVYRILLNLVGNALRYTLRGGVLVACRSVNATREVEIQVWDTGIGIAPEYQQDIFKEFYQINNAARERNKGLGLGLSIVQRTADLLGHRVALKSRQGVGSRFTLTLPTAPALPDVMVLPMAYSDPHDDLKGIHVWVIEDDELVLSALVGLLEDWGMKVQTAHDLQEVEKLITAGPVPDLILSDYRLKQGQNGIKVIQHLRARLNSPIPSCLISGNTDPELMAAATAARLTLLHKPVRPAKLRNLLRRLLKKGQVMEEDLR